MDARCLLPLLFALAPAPAHGADRVELDWAAPPGCPDRAAVLAELERLTAAASPPLAPMRSRGSIARDGQTWKLHLELEFGGDGPAVRELQDASCIRLAQVAALSLALALESGAPPVAPKIAQPTHVDLEPPRYLVRAFLGGDLGSLRAPSPGPALAVGLFLGRTRLELVAAYWMPQTVSGLEYQLVSAGLHACNAITEAPEIGLCAGIDGGRMQARFVDGGRTVVHGWLGLTGGAALGWSFTPWLALRLEVGVGLTLVAPALEADAESERGPSNVFGRAGLGLEARFR